MNVDYDLFRTTLTAMSRGKAAHAELLTVVQVSRALVEAYLRVRMSSLSYLYRDQGLTPTDLAYDCLADAFRTVEANRYPKIESFAASLDGPIDGIPAVEVFVAFRGFITRLAKAHIAGLFYQADPAGGKIHRNIRDCVKHHAGLRLADTIGGLSIVVVPEMPVRTGVEFPPEKFESELRARADSDRTTAGILGHAREILLAHPEFGGRVRLFDLVGIVKGLFGSDHIDRLPEPALELEGLMECDIQVIRDRTLGAVKEKIFLTYLGNGKLTRREAGALYAAVADVVDDWIDGSDGEVTLSARLEKYLSSGAEIYADRYRAKLEYLVKTARAEMAALLSKEL